VDIRDETPVEAASDEAELARFGYRQELRRSLGLFSSFAVAFSYISPSTGIFTLFALGLSTVGGLFFWSWPIVAIGQFIIALSFAEVSSHIPVAGSVYQWAKYLSNKTQAWFNGWIYLFAGILTVTAVAVTLPLALIPALNGIGWHMANSLHNQRIMALVAMVVVSLLNIYGVRVVALINNVGVLFEILGMVVFAFVMALFHNHQGVGVVFHSGGTNVTMSTFLVAMFMSLFVIYGFDTASTLAEETRNPRKEAPKAVLYSIAGAFVIGGIFIWATLMAVPNTLASGVKGALGPAQIIDANFSNAFATTYLTVVSIAIFICLLAIQANTMRLCFGMARDEQLPGSMWLRNVSPRLNTPWVACIAVTALAAVPLIQYAGAAYLAIAATGLIYVSYFIVGVAILRARYAGWPRRKAPFKLGVWGIPVSILGLLWGGAMLVNFAWPRFASNPTPDQTGYLNFHWGWLNHRPILWTVFIVIGAVGAAYYALVQRHKPAHIEAPEGEVPSAVTTT
jgi:amino acid transporter